MHWSIHCWVGGPPATLCVLGGCGDGGGGTAAGFPRVFITTWWLMSCHLRRPPPCPSHGVQLDTPNPTVRSRCLGWVGVTTPPPGHPLPCQAMSLVSHWQQGPYVAPLAGHRGGLCPPPGWIWGCHWRVPLCNAPCSHPRWAAGPLRGSKPPKPPPPTPMHSPFPIRARGCVCPPKNTFRASRGDAEALWGFIGAVTSCTRRSPPVWYLWGMGDPGMLRGGGT